MNLCIPSVPKFKNKTFVVLNLFNFSKFSFKGSLKDSNLPKIKKKFKRFVVFKFED